MTCHERLRPSSAAGFPEVELNGAFYRGLIENERISVSFLEDCKMSELILAVGIRSKDGSIRRLTGMLHLPFRRMKKGHSLLIWSGQVPVDRLLNPQEGIHHHSLKRKRPLWKSSRRSVVLLSARTMISQSCDWMDRAPVLYAPPGNQ
jgi:hypothetical protein